MSGDSCTPTALAAAVTKAESEGFEVVRSDARSLLVDLDTPEAQAQFKRVLPVVQEHFGAGVPEVWFSKSGNLHARVPLTCALDIHIRYGLQAALGSDGVREALNFVQLWIGCEEPSMLFKPHA